MFTPIYVPELCQKLPTSGLVISATAIFPSSSDQFGNVNILVPVGSLCATFLLALLVLAKALSHPCIFLIFASHIIMERMALFLLLLWRVFITLLSHAWGLGLLQNLKRAWIRFREILLWPTCGGVCEFASIILQHILFSGTPVVWIILRYGPALSSLWVLGFVHEDKRTGVRNWAEGML